MGEVNTAIKDTGSLDLLIFEVEDRVFGINVAKVQEIIEHAFNHDKDFDDIMADWNEAWSEAQAALNVEVK